MISLLLTLPAAFMDMVPSKVARTAASRGGPSTMGILDEVDKWIETNVGKVQKKSNVAGGSGWSTCTRYAIEGSDKELFVKASGSRNLESMFLGEALGLKALGASGALAIPEVLHLSLIHI